MAVADTVKAGGVTEVVAEIADRADPFPGSLPADANERRSRWRFGVAVHSPGYIIVPTLLRFTEARSDYSVPGWTNSPQSGETL